MSDNGCMYCRVAFAPRNDKRESCHRKPEERGRGDPCGGRSDVFATMRVHPVFGTVFRKVRLVRQADQVMMMTEVINVHEAKTHLSRLLDRVRAGENIVLGKSGEPYARLIPYRVVEPRRAFGALRGRLRVPEAFTEPLPADELEAWGS